MLEEFSQALENEDYDQVNALRGKLESRFDKMQSVRSEVGAKVNRVELTRERLKDLETNLTSLQAKTEDADIIKLIYEEKIQENCYQTSLAVGSKIIMPSLVDFMR
ncbi:flagellin [Paenibacillus larvae]|nr:flagellin [Paenibacillus larvae]MDT2239865.1 flagellin [Paenibacillus larvae]